MLERPLILTGFMGSGKSSVGPLLAEMLGWRFVDLDAEIAAVAGKSIKQIFAEDGERHFRLLESNCLEKLLAAGAAVISGGGGVVVAARNRQMMRQHGYVVNLQASLKVILDRLKGAADRPLYEDENATERVCKLLEERKDFYADADIRIDTDNKSVEDVAAEIFRVLKGLPV